MPIYNLTGIVQNSTSMLTFTQGVNTSLMGGMFGNLLLIGLFMVMVSGFFWTTKDWAKSFGAASFLTFIFSLLLTALNLATPLSIFISIVVTAGSVAFMYKS